MISALATIPLAWLAEEYQTEKKSAPLKITVAEGKVKLYQYCQYPKRLRKQNNLPGNHPKLS